MKTKVMTTMMTMTMTTMVAMALTILTACDYAARQDLRNERDDRGYREAMDDYRAGRMDAAMTGFENAVRRDPANASARFQLACLQQDLRKDYVSAYCGYREFVLQQPESDRAKLAKDRMASCEKAVAEALATKYGLNAAEGAASEISQVRAELKSMKDRVAMAEKNLGSSQERVRSLVAERDRLLAVIKGFDEAQPAAAASGLDDVLREKRALEREAEVDSGVTQTVLDEKLLLESEEEEENSAATSLLPVRKPEDLVRREEEKPAEAAEAPKVPDHPKTYVVEEGDTLYGIAKKFYGSIQPWKAIRDANKAVISSDNRLKAGDTIVLP